MRSGHPDLRPAIGRRTPPRPGQKPACHRSTENVTRLQARGLGRCSGERALEWQYPGPWADSISRRSSGATGPGAAPSMGLRGSPESSQSDGPGATARTTAENARPRYEYSGRSNVNHEHGFLIRKEEHPCSQ